MWQNVRKDFFGEGATILLQPPINMATDTSRTVDLIDAATTNDTIPPTPSSIAVSDGENNDDPPPYALIAPPNHVRCWPFSTGLAPFQPSQLHPESNVPIAAASVPLMPYRMLRLGSSIFPQRHDDGRYGDDEHGCKVANAKTRRYGAILVAAAVIVFLMALSLMVRFVVEKSFWRG